jgi:hypothetical protein
MYMRAQRFSYVVMLLLTRTIQLVARLAVLAVVACMLLHNAVP